MSYFEILQAIICFCIVSRGIFFGKYYSQEGGGGNDAAGEKMKKKSKEKGKKGEKREIGRKSGKWEVKGGNEKKSLKKYI